MTNNNSNGYYRDRSSRRQSQDSTRDFDSFRSQSSLDSKTTRNTRRNSNSRIDSKKEFIGSQNRKKEYSSNQHRRARPREHNARYGHVHNNNRSSQYNNIDKQRANVGLRDAGSFRRRR